MRDTAQASHLAATRLLRLTSHELRGVGMTLRGHADHLASAPGPAADAGPALHDLALHHAHVASIAGAAAQILSLADELQDHAFPALAPRILREEVVDLAALLTEAVAAAAAALAPGRRSWRMAPVDAPILVWADRRALRHVLARVLTDAARSTAHDDWIDLSFQRRHDGLVLLVSDEGAGLATPEAAGGLPVRGGADSRGVGLRLTLARGLMEAHGGRLEVEAAAHIGSHVSLLFPSSRLRQQAAGAVSGDAASKHG